ncbi:putative N-carbamoyl-L-amino acid hydrolase [Venturia nashicola]|nr:putative N-carbamoyl-L-amino acid hydrolase [Venturia nashicola]
MAGFSKPLEIDAAALKQTWLNACEHGQLPAAQANGLTTGMNRLALNADDKLARDWFVEEMKALGCDIKIDKMGNIFATLPGQNDQLPPIGIGSHLDTQPTGGRYDGILGICLGISILRSVVNSGKKPYAPLSIINWTNEEGARFKSCMVGSGVWSGAIPLEKAWGLKDDEGISLISELEKTGYLGTTECDHKANPLLAHFECHIEQGPKLDCAEEACAVVEGVESIMWYYITLYGKEGHAGSTPMKGRQDALLGAAKIIDCANRIVTDEALESGRLGARATVAWIQSEPQSLNTIAGKVKIGLDLRARTDGDMAVVVSEIKKQFMEIAEKQNLKMDLDHAWTSAGRDFDPKMRACLSAAAEEEGCKMKLVSHIGHDSVYCSSVVPTAMLFTRCKEGMSHHPSEFAREEDCVTSARVLLKAWEAYDEKIREEHEKK